LEVVGGHVAEPEAGLQHAPHGGEHKVGGGRGVGGGEFPCLAQNKFDGLVSTDKGIPHQQSVPWFGLAVVLLRARSNAREDLAPLMEEVNAALASVEAGTVVRIPAQRWLDP
jgi:hypothetical protein